MTLAELVAFAVLLAMVVSRMGLMPLDRLHDSQRAIAERYRQDQPGDPPIEDVGEFYHWPAWCGQVTARYGSFVSVRDMAGDPDQADSPNDFYSRPAGRGEVPFVWAGRKHGWMKEAKDYLYIVPAPPGLTTTDGDGKTVTIRWMALGTMPEFDPDTFGGVQATCAFDPDEPLEDCMYTVADDARPVV